MATRQASPGHDPEDELRRERRRRLQREYLRYSGVGLEFALTVAIVGGLGWWLDDLAGLGGRFPLFLLLGVFAGMAAGIVRLNLRLGSRRPPREPRERPPDGPDS